ncbi:hypothetical protein FD723_05645 [Nostoc sp. C052]|uniref:hypothetical protein n=1 Tax=Nostoc sp. C052 TaxID=2576902 RepID=UPI0015C3343A|nr:hypothetical protein [Nostoc sp. C052]QLE39996.1 hypothetical protein FD723_05645 [Nostoc sp. C052]
MKTIATLGLMVALMIIMGSPTYAFSTNTIKNILKVVKGFRFFRAVQAHDAILAIATGGVLALAGYGIYRFIESRR